MLISRWQAPLVPDRDQIWKMFEAEGMEPFEDRIEPQSEIKDIRNPFDEVRTVVRGELLLDVAGNKLLLREGDRIYIPSNTKHSKKNQSNETCICVCAHKV